VAISIGTRIDCRTHKASRDYELWLIALIRGGHGSCAQESTQAGFWAFFGPGSGVKNFWKTWPRLSHFFGSSRSLLGPNQKEKRFFKSV